VSHNASITIRVLQYCTVCVMWVFSAAITLWVLQLASVAYALADAFTASVSITLIALPIYWALAGILTYTFFGLRRGQSPELPPSQHTRA
jgi:hypothetical protein